MASPLRSVSNQILQGTASAIGTPLILSSDGYSNLAARQKVILTGFPLPGGETVDLDLNRFYLTTTTPQIVIAGQDGSVAIPPPGIVLFRGTILDRAKTRVILTVSPRGLQGLITTENEVYALYPEGTLKNTARGSVHTMVKRSDLADPRGAALPISLTDVLPNPESKVLKKPPSLKLPGSFQVVRLALDCDFEFYSQFNNFELALDYIYTLFAALGDIFERDLSTKLALVFIRIWTTSNDPYEYVGGGTDGAWEFRRYWIDHHDPGSPDFIFRDIAHLVSGRPVGSHGWLGVLCDFDLGYSISGGMATNPTIAEKLFHDIPHAGHEIGHNFNGMHTHCLKDPLTDDWVDKCGTEADCNQTQDCTTAPGSIMSYCNQCPGGLNNVLHQFDSVNIGRMRSHIIDSCVPAALSTVYVDHMNDTFADGSLAHPWPTVWEGANYVLPQGTVSIWTGNYTGPSFFWQPMTLTARGGSVIIQK